MKHVRIRSPFLCMALTAFLLAAPCALAQDGLRGALSEVGGTRSLLRDPLGLNIAAADFDNDERPDGAVLLNGGQLRGRQSFRIRLHVTATQDRELTFQSNETELALSALDVNQDGLPDLVVEQVFTHKRLQVWLNDGNGRFRQARVEDFPPFIEAPCKWNAPDGEPGSLVLALPSRSGDNHADLLLRALRFNSSSSNWRKRSGSQRIQSGTFALYSPRSPPLVLPA